MSMRLKGISDLGANVRPHAPPMGASPAAPHGLDYSSGQQSGRLSDRYWNMVAAGPAATDAMVDASALPPLRMPAGIQIAPVAARGVAAISASGTAKNSGLLALRHVSETEARALTSAWQALLHYETPKPLMAAIENATSQRNVLITAGDLVKANGVNSAAIDSLDELGAKQRLLILDRSLVRMNNGAPSQRLVGELYDLLLKEQSSLGVATDKTVLKVGKQEIFFKHELDLNRRRDQFQRELGAVSEFESDYVARFRDELTLRGAWGIHKKAVLAAV